MPTVDATWNDATADWNTPSDWSDGIVPDDINTNVTRDGSGAYTISIASAESFTVGTLLFSDARAEWHFDADLAYAGPYLGIGPPAPFVTQRETVQ